MKRDMQYQLKLKRKAYMRYCTICSVTERLEQHRIDPNGTYAAKNVIIVCRGCHLTLHRMLIHNTEDYRNIVKGKNWAEQPQYLDYDEEYEETEEVNPWDDGY